MRPCILCGRPPPYEHLFSPPGYPGAIVRCPECGLAFQDPQPDEDVLARSYYHDPAFAESLLGEFRAVTLTRARDKLALLKDLRVARAGMRILDVGSSSGAWLEVAQEVGMQATGVEIGEVTASQAQARGLDVRAGTLEQSLPGLAGERFDLITFWDVLEHLRDPRRELALAARLLSPDGLLAATFPNIDGWYPRATRRLIAARAGVWEYPELPLHLYEFAPATARRLFEQAGYSVLSLRTRSIPFSFYRATTLSLDRLGRGPRGVALRLAFEALRGLIYPAARLCGRENSLFLAASLRSPSR